MWKRSLKSCNLKTLWTTSCSQCRKVSVRSYLQLILLMNRVRAITMLARVAWCRAIRRLLLIKVEDMCLGLVELWSRMLILLRILRLLANSWISKHQETVKKLKMIINKNNKISQMFIKKLNNNSSNSNLRDTMLILPMLLNNNSNYNSNCSKINVTKLQSLASSKQALYKDLLQT